METADVSKRAGDRVFAVVGMGGFVRSRRVQERAAWEGGAPVFFLFFFRLFCGRSARYGGRRGIKQHREITLMMLDAGDAGRKPMQNLYNLTSLSALCEVST